MLEANPDVCSIIIHIQYSDDQVFRSKKIKPGPYGGSKPLLHAIFYKTASDSSNETEWYGLRELSEITFFLCGRLLVLTLLSCFGIGILFLEACHQPFFKYG